MAKPQTKPQTKPVLSEITKEHDCTCFDCERESINEYLKDYAWQNHRSGRSKTYVAHKDDNKVLGFYSICPAEIKYEDVVVDIKKGQPSGQKISGYKIAQLGVDKNHKKQGIGTALLKDALLNAYAAANKAGGRVVIVDAIDEEIVSFYQERGFQTSLENCKLLMIKVSDIKALLEE